MNLSVDPRVVALYNSSPETQLSQYALAASSKKEESKNQKPSKRGLVSRTLRRRKRGRVQAQKKSSQSVKPKSNWETQSFTVLISGLQEKREKGNLLQSISSWDDSSDNASSTINENSSTNSLGQIFSVASSTLPDIDDWDAVSVSTEASIVDDCDTCRSTGSSVVVWEPVRIERQSVVTVIERELSSSDCYALATIPKPSALPSLYAANEKHSLGNRDTKSKKGVKSSRAGLRRYGMMVPGQGNKQLDEIAMSLVKSDTFLVYQANARASEIQ